MGKRMAREALDAALANLHAVMPDRRKELLARVAGTIAGGIISDPPVTPASESSMAAAIATIAVDIAEEILKKAGIPATEAPAKMSSAMGNAAEGATS